VIDVAELLAERVRETIFEIGGELDGPAAGFGTRLKALMIASNPALADVLSEPCLEIRYTDRYLFSPLVLRLLTELLRGLAGPATRLEIETLAQRRSPPRRGRGLLQDDWQDPAVRDVVLRHLLGTVTPTVQLNLHQGVAHNRRLEFRSRRGSGTIFFDQGVGSWSVSGNEGFDMRADHAAQLQEIEKPFTVANGPDGTFFAVRLD
jgi:hypothetical protein